MLKPKHKKLTRDQLETAIEDEWSNMHHNASIHNWPDIKNEYESSLFDSWLGDHTSMCIDDLKSMIKEKFGQDLDFYQYGRSGATIAPDRYMRSAPGGSFGGLSYSLDDGLSGYNDGLKILDLFKTINKYWKDTASDIPRAWRKTKEMNEWQANIDAHDNMESYQATLWRLKK